jgi:dinuclear metal center YbgI/SA1388 family protein
MKTRKELLNYLNTLLTPELFHDYCPNGLQVEGSTAINKIICGVSLNQDLINHAIHQKATTILVHHGLLWNKADPSITGSKYQRLAALIKHKINLFAYHLPLDNHLTLGNNAQLAQLLNLKVKGQCAEQKLLWYGELPRPITLSQFTTNYLNITGHKALSFGNPQQFLSKVAWCTGAADSFFNEAINLGVDGFISGEVAESIPHLAQESGVAYFAAGHYVSERYGIMALAKHLCTQGWDAEFIDIYNPV